MTTRTNNREVLQEDKIQPHDTDTENTVLATLMRYNGRFEENRDILGSDMFYYPREKAIYMCIEGVIKSGGITDINSLADYAVRHDVGYSLDKVDFLNIFNLVSTPTLEQDIRRLREMGIRRQCWRLLQQASQNILDLTTDFNEEIDGVLSSVREVQNNTCEDEVVDYGDAMDEVVTIAQGNREGHSQHLVTGFDIFDKNYLLRAGTFTVIAAFPAVGKSALALNVSEYVAKSGIPVAYYSMEMDKTELASRSITKEMGLPAYAIMNRPLNDVQMARLIELKEKWKNLPIYFDDRNTVTFDGVMRSIRKLAKTKNIKLAVIDYLQIFNQSMNEEEEYLSYMARACKDVAKETGIAVIALSQLNRSALHPSLRALRGSGQIEESADNVVLIDRPEAYPDNKVTKYEGKFSDNSIKGTAKLILGKGRGTQTDSYIVAFNGEYTRFSDIQKPTETKVYEHNDDLPF